MPSGGAGERVASDDGILMEVRGRRQGLISRASDVPLVPQRMGQAASTGLEFRIIKQGDRRDGASS